MGALIALALLMPSHAIEARGGFVLVDLAVPVAPPIPVVSGDLSWHHRLGDAIELGARYQTHLGAVHRLGPEARAAWMVGGGWALGGRVWVSGSLTGAWQDGVDAGGDVATLAMASVAWDLGGDRLSVEGGVSVEWLLWEHIAGRSAVDAAPYLAYYEAAAEWRHGLGDDAWLSLRGEVAVPFDEDPYAPWGLYPRVVFGGGFGW